jgi:hypothetical protein
LNSGRTERTSISGQAPQKFERPYFKTIKQIETRDRNHALRYAFRPDAIATYAENLLKKRRRKRKLLKHLQGLERVIETVALGWVGEDFLHLVVNRRGVQGVPLGMTRLHSECPDSAAPDPPGVADVLLRQAPDEEEDEEEEDHKKEDGDSEDQTDDGYSD